MDQPISGAQPLWLLDSPALSFSRALTGELQTSPSCQAGPAPLGTWDGTGDNVAWLRPWSPALSTAQQVRAPASPRPRPQPVTLCCVCLFRAMVCSQRSTSLSQSPRVGFLSSLLPQSKKSPSRLSPAQGPPPAQSAAKKESVSSQVSASPTFPTLASDT